MGLILDMKRVTSKSSLFASYVVLDGETDFVVKQIITEQQYREAYLEYGRDAFDARMGAEAIKVLLERINLKELAADLRIEMRESWSRSELSNVWKSLKDS